ncbi:exocyst complex component Sec5-domain-containing protein [Lineolata rhizophorae]|uniref:Exocyst complex component Sec5-domain-containing protein n=1 Tax=Lineolata rhizophorae TaxID=578093 RepID=A0A6A6NX82_9PEZI|nr:exocyst complex component Sec5-domain-containing protein [Lineolata rhizophorae]
MADLERDLRNHYNLRTLTPERWPDEKDASSDDDGEVEYTNATASRRLSRRPKSRYSALERASSSRASIPNSQRTKDGIENLVQKDEPDPLGAAASVVQVLRSRGLPVEQDSKLRNRFLLSSTTFSPALFLSQVHSDASTESLLQGLDFLSRSIEKKSASLKVLVESNFERFVRAKATIDNVYTEMRSQGAEPAGDGQQRPGSAGRPQSRHANKSGGPGHFRSASSQQQLSPTGGGLQSEKRKNALTKESEYGVLGLKTPILEAAVKAEEVWGPALGGQEREEMLKAVLASVERNRDLFEIGPALRDAIKRRDYDALVEEHTRAHRCATDARFIVDNAVANRMPVTDPQIHQIIVTARMWSDVQEQIEQFKRFAWARLAGSQFPSHSRPGAPADEARSEEYMQLMGILLELGVEDNPIWYWLMTRYDFLKSKIQSTAERSRVEIEILRRRLANGDKPAPRTLAMHLRSVSGERPGETPRPTSNTMDTPQVLEFWEHVYLSLSALLSTSGGVLGEVIEFWDIAKSFIDGKAQRSLPMGIDGASARHHRLSADDIGLLVTEMANVFDMIRESVFGFFSDPPIDDISLLLSPAPGTPDTPRTPLSASINGLLSPTSAGPSADARFDPANMPPPSPSRGEPWEKYAFWPPHANALSGTHYLNRLLVLVGAAVGEMAASSVVREGGMRQDALRALVGGVRERCVQAVCAAWGADLEALCKASANGAAGGGLEDWERCLPERRDLTRMPARFAAFEAHLLGSVQRILFVSEAMSRNGASEVIVPPSAKLLQLVRSSFFGGLYKVIGGMVECAERGVARRGVGEGGARVVAGWNEEEDGLTVPLMGNGEAGARSGAGGLGYGPNRGRPSKNVRILLTLSNLQHMRADTVRNLISTFETNFSVKVSDEDKAARELLGQIDARLFQAYVAPIAERIAACVTAKITSAGWCPPDAPRPADASQYVYDILLDLVVVHTEVSTTAAPLTGPILKYLLERLTKAMKNALTQRPRYNLHALMQATLDVEFMAQTLGNYTTDGASQLQSDIYVRLDERTDAEARGRLQAELPHLRSILKGLRERTKGEFAMTAPDAGAGGANTTTTHGNTNTNGANGIDTIAATAPGATHLHPSSAHQQPQPPPQQQHDHQGPATTAPPPTSGGRPRSGTSTPGIPRSKSHSISSRLSSNAPPSTAATSRGWGMGGGDGGAADSRDRNRAVRTLPPWIRSVEDDEDELPAPPYPSHAAHHHYLPAPKPNAVPGRAYDHERERTPVTISSPMSENASKWQRFAHATTVRGLGGGIGLGTGYDDDVGSGGSGGFFMSGGGGVASAGTSPERRTTTDGPDGGVSVMPHSEVVDDNWLRQNMPDLEKPWQPEDLALLDRERSGGTGRHYWLFSPRGRRAKLKQWRRTLLRNPMVPLLVRLTVLMFSVLAMALAAAIFNKANQSGCSRGSSTWLALVVDAVAIAYTCCITWDEYTSKPLGLRSPRAKMRLIFLDLFFIVFDSANLSLAFEALTDERWACRSGIIADDAAPLPSENGEPISQAAIDNLTTCPFNHYICVRQKALTATLLIALLAWLVTFAISTLRVVERVVSR